VIALEKIKNQKSNLKTKSQDLGVGVGLRPAHYNEFLNKKPTSVSWVEVISENYMPWTTLGFGQALQTLKQVRTNYPVFLHGVSLNIGSADSVNKDYLDKLKKLIHEIEPAHVSDHLSWTGVNSENLHDLLPLPYTQETLTHTSEKIDFVQNFLGRQIMLENPSSYFEFQQSEMTEWDFISQLCTTSDCGLLLDINNVYVSSVNHGFDPLIYLNSIPKNSIKQIHLAGHTKKNGYLIDTHDAPICSEVWHLYRKSLQLYGNISTMVERDGNIPEWAELEKEVLTIKGIRDETPKREDIILSSTNTI
jgi:uncharacterized protein (UPF0276 family)